MFRDWQDDGAPTIRVIWNKTPRARKPHLCETCDEEIKIGEVYESSGYYEDGEFKTWKKHLHANHYPSGCPKFRLRDQKEMREAGWDV